MAATHARSHRSVKGGFGGGRPPLKVGDLLAGKYRVERILGEGGMGVVVAAYHELLDQRVAVKLLYQDVADREAQSRLLLEARASAKLQSEHITRVIDVDTGPDGLPFIVMELLEGVDLCEIADARGALPRWLVVDYILQTLEGLAHAHARGIVHRDLKPSNLFLANRADGSQIIKILDFGISKTQDPPEDRRSQQLTGGRAVLGSPPYMSPEQVRSPKSVDHRTDIWALGICMYELLTNSMPFGGDEIQETFAQILESEPAPIRMLVNGVPDGLERAVMKCLQKKRDLRFADVGELARALAPFGSGTWSQYADRVGATLTRVAEEIAKEAQQGSGPRVGNPATDRTSIPASPRRLDSMQPELNGTASTVHGRFDPKRRFLYAAIGISAALIGTGLIAMTLVSRSHKAAPTPTELASEPPPEPTTAGPATAVVTAPIHTAAPENELPGAPVSSPTIIGASPLPPSSNTSQQASRTPPRFTPAPRPALTTAPPKTKPTSSSRPALPPGLPLTRQ
jgi:serine/threonine-protein kinase